MKKLDFVYGAGATGVVGRKGQGSRPKAKGRGQARVRVSFRGWADGMPGAAG